MKYLVLFFIAITVFACSKSKDANDEKSDDAQMYEASELSAVMRDMVEFSKAAKQALADSQVIDIVPTNFYDFGTAKATRGEHEEDAFQSMVPAYLNALKGIERKDSQQYYYDASIAACKSCHGVYCGGPMAVINQL